jgi:predicted nucleic acid-binding protein
VAKIFWDTNLFIYLFENHPVLARTVEDLRRRMLARGDRLYTSTLTIGEILVKPLAMNHAALAERYIQFFRSPAIAVVAFDANAASIYARVRQDRGIGRADAVQLACAAASQVDLFLTNDSRLSRKLVPGIQFISSLEAAPL